MDFAIIATLAAVLIGFLYFLYGPGAESPKADAFTEDELASMDTKKKKKPKQARAHAPAPAPAPAPALADSEDDEPVKKKKKKKKSKKAAKPAAVAEPVVAPKKGKGKKAKKAAPEQLKQSLDHHDSSEYDGEWSTVASKERPSPKKSAYALDAGGEAKVVDTGTDIDLGRNKAACIGKGGEVIKRLTLETGARFNISKEDSTCTITGTPEQQQAGVAAVQAILQAEMAYKATNSYEDSIEVGTKVGAVVGKGGSTIKSIQAECGNVRLNIETDEETGNGTVFITGERSMVEKAKAMVAIIIEGGMMPGEISTEIDLGSIQAKLAFIGDGGSNIRAMQQTYGAKLDLPRDKGTLLRISGPEEKVMAASAAVRDFIERNCRKHVMDITRHVGAIIGKRGSTIKRLIAESGARMDVVEDAMGGQDLEIFGTAAQVKTAVDMVDEIKRDADDPRPKILEGEILEEFEVPENCIGSIIGRAGAKIKAMQEETGAKINIPRNTCTCYVSGPEESVKVCKEKIDFIIEENAKFERMREERAEAAAKAAEDAAAAAEAGEDGEVEENED